MPTISEVPLPSDPCERDWADYQSLSRTLDTYLGEGPGFNVDDATALENARLDVDNTMARFLAREDGVAVGFAVLQIRIKDDPTGGIVFVYVLPGHRRRGVGGQLFGRLMEAVGEAGLRRLEAWTSVRPEGQRRLVPTSGVGSVPADDDGVRFALAHGFTLEQVERVSRYDFAAPLVDPTEAFAEAAAAAGEEYEVSVFHGPAPDALLAGLAVLRERMSVDPPSGGMAVIETVWDAERLRDRDERLLATSHFWRAVVRHRPTGQVVAVNEIARDRTNPEAFLEQWDTIVVPEHRGHRLGMLVKAANLIQVHEAAPDASAIMTWNAEENRYMLNVNEALGFRQVLIEAAFQRRL